MITVKKLINALSKFEDNDSVSNIHKSGDVTEIRLDGDNFIILDEIEGEVVIKKITLEKII